MMYGHEEDRVAAIAISGISMFLSALALGISIASFVFHSKAETQKADAIMQSANEYCISQGFDGVTEREHYFNNDYTRVKCVSDHGYTWYSYPPDSEKEKFCKGTL